MWAAVAIASVWMVSTGEGGGAARPEVHSVETSEREVVVRSAGVSMYFLGALQTRPAGAEQAQRFEFRIPRQAPVAKPARAADGLAGVFANGVPLYALCGSADGSHEDRDLWRFDRVRGGPRSPLLDRLLQDGARHSPILGYTLAGAPIYGPWARDEATGAFRRMRSSYRLRADRSRRSWPGGLALLPAQAGPSDAAPGTFCEDYEFIREAGDLDEFNGRFARTPEYPDGVYAHFLSVDESGAPAFPYLLGPAARPAQPLARVEFMRTGNRLTWTLRAANGSAIERLERVHERPMHLLIVSEELTDFAHVHPEQTPDGSYAVEHRFDRGGRYHLYADFTAPGAPQQIDHRVVEAVGPAAETLGEETRAQVTLPAEPLHAGRDLTFRVKVNPDGLEPYLGAWGHFVLIGEGHTAFQHVHPEGAGGGAAAADHHASLREPAPTELRFATNFPRAGRYKLWAQFQRDGAVEVATYTFDVQGAVEAPTLPAVPPGAVRVDVSHAGFSPAEVKVSAARTVKIAFVRAADAGGCASRVVVPSAGIDRPLPPGSVTVIELLAPAESKEVRFTCGMGMLRGALVASSRRD